MIKQILALTCQHPAWGHIRLAAQARLQGIDISSGTIYSIWKKRGLNRAWKRWLWAEEQYQKREILLTEAQIQELEKLNPCLKERHVESFHPGYLLSQDTFFVGHFKGIGKVYMQVVIDTYCSLGFAKLYTARNAINAADLLHDRVIPFYQGQKLPIFHILTDNGSEYCGRPNQHPYQLLLALQGIKHRRTRVATPRTNGFVERFNRTVLNEFFRGILRRKYYSKLEELQKDLDGWMIHYNEQRPHLGYRNHGNTPMLSLKQYQNQN